MSDQVSHPHKTTCKLKILCILSFMCLEYKLKENDSVKGKAVPLQAWSDSEGS